MTNTKFPNGIETTDLTMTGDLVVGDDVTVTGDVVATGDVTGSDGVLATLTLGTGGTKITKLKVYSSAQTPAAVAANTAAEQDFTVTGVAATDKILSVVKPTAQAGLGIVGFRVKALNTVAVTFGNFTASEITPTAAQAYVITVLSV